ncbi:short chain dehydrogenase [Streptomyces sp. 3213]|uniref:SDR family NAD(P)-dependent oxidoreductase n=1 Tax=Streptomyces sp. 3213.3 TaxID=1855348 RepID=UPI00089A59D8|nr:short chain dehydrogenase [Streptomyces sp. 3213] [Streptomyces sp. 3213.3]
MSRTTPENHPDRHASRFTGRTALLTAAASGIGAATARRLAEEGASVLVTDVDAAGAETVAEEVRAKGGQARHLGLDVTNPEAWPEAIRTAQVWTGRLERREPDGERPYVRRQLPAGGLGEGGDLG